MAKNRAGIFFRSSELRLQRSGSGQPYSYYKSFDTPVSVSEIRMYARTLKTSLTEGVCPNYPKVYTVETSADGQSWTELASEDEGLIRSTKTAMSTTTFDGDIRAQVGIPGRFVPAYDADPVSVTVYEGKKETSEYPGRRSKCNQPGGRTGPEVLPESRPDYDY